VCIAFGIMAVALFRPSATYKTARYSCLLLMWVVGAHVRVEGEFPREGTFIVMFNHTSFIDMFLVPTFMRGRYTGVMAEERMRYPLLRPLLRRFRAVPIVREDQERAMAALQRAKEALAEGFHVVILPEGTRTTDGAMLPFKSGGFHMAVQTGAPILPVGISGAFDYKPKDRWTIDPGPVHIRVGRPIPPEEYGALGPAGLKERVRAEIGALSAATPS
jgi:1-acyl-sn-glycerol-3-phosphate acyltransferase